MCIFYSRFNTWKRNPNKAYLLIKSTAVKLVEIMSVIALSLPLKTDRQNLWDTMKADPGLMLLYMNAQFGNMEEDKNTYK